MSKELAVLPRTMEAAPGWHISVRPAKPTNSSKFGSTAYHEALHAVASVLTGTGVIEASKEPGPGYLGITRLEKFNLTAFIAAHAMGCDGTGHDVAVIRMMGHDPGSAAWAARELLVRHEEEINAVASSIEANGSISGRQVEESMENAANPKIMIEVTDPTGRMSRFVARMIDLGEYFDPSQRFSLMDESEDKLQENEDIKVYIPEFIHPLLDKIQEN